MDLLPAESRLRWLLRSTARLLDGGTEPVRGLVLPTAEFFPDDFDRSPQAVARLLARVAEHAGLADVPLRSELVGVEDGAGGGGSCSTGCCGTAPAAPGSLRRVRSDETNDDGYVVAVLPQEASNPTVLTTGLVRAVSHIFMKEAELYAEFDRPEAEPVVDVAGALLGFGVLLANGSYLYSKGCGSVKIGSATKLPVQEISTALAIFCQLHQIQPRTCRGQLEVTPRSHFDEASLWARSNASVIRLLRSDRTAFEADSYRLSEARSWLSRLFGLGRARGPSVPTDDELEKMAKQLSPKREAKDVDPDKQRRLDEIRELVDEALER